MFGTSWTGRYVNSLCYSSVLSVVLQIDLSVSAASLCLSSMVALHLLFYNIYNPSKKVLLFPFKRYLNNTWMKPTLTEISIPSKHSILILPEPVHTIAKEIVGLRSSQLHCPQLSACLWAMTLKSCHALYLQKLVKTGSKAKANSFCTTVKYSPLTKRCYQDPIFDLRYKVKQSSLLICGTEKYEWHTLSLRKAEVLSYPSPQLQEKCNANKIRNFKFHSGTK